MSLHVTSVVIDGNEKAVFLVELRDLAKIDLLIWAKIFQNNIFYSYCFLATTKD